MPRYQINDSQSQVSKKLIKKIGEFPVNDNNLIGYVRLLRIRKYTFSWEVDVEFDGEAFFRLNKKGSFHKSKILSVPNISKIKVNRILKKYLAKYVDLRLRYFGARLKWYTDIKVIKWK